MQETGFSIATKHTHTHVRTSPNRPRGQRSTFTEGRGGIGNITGALLGGILLGLVEAFFSALLPFFPSFGTGYSDIFAFSILILILIFRPTGLLGQRVDEKV